MKFKASLSNTVYVITSVALVLLLVATYTILNKPELGQVYKTFSISFFWLVMVFCFVFHPTGYTVNKDTVIIHRPLASVTINKSDLTECRPVSDEDMKWTIRTFGVSGLFGYFGKFTNTTIGAMTWYATQRENYVLLTMANKSLILTPDEPQQFVAAIGL